MNRNRGGLAAWQLAHLNVGETDSTGVKVRSLKNKSLVIALDEEEKVQPKEKKGHGRFILDYYYYSSAAACNNNINNNGLSFWPIEPVKKYIFYILIQSLYSTTHLQNSRLCWRI